MTEASKLCDFKHFTETNCTGEFVHIFECDRNTQKHLTSLKSSESIPGRPFHSYDCPESLLILFRSGVFSVDQTALNLYICESHRVFFGLNWRRTKTRCIYPGHNTTSKAKSDRGAYPTLCKELFLKTRQILPVGSEICKQCSTHHRKNISTQLNIDFETELEHLTQLQRVLIGKDEQSSQDDSVQESVSKESMGMDTEESDIFSCTTGNSQQTCSQDWLEAQRNPRDKLNAAMSILSDSFEPLQSQLTKPWNSLSSSTKSYYSKKANECVGLILGIIAPGQDSYLVQDILKKSPTSISTGLPALDSTTQSVIDAYNNVTDSKTKTQILSVIVNKYSKTELQNLIPGLTVFKIDGARKHALVSGPGQILNQPRIYRIKLTKPKVTHFIEFMMNPLYSSIVGFGQTVLKFSSNQKLQIPKVIRTVIHSRIINIYLDFCKENSFETFSRATLYRILQVCHASKQKALQGLDNTTAAGMNSVDTLLKLCSKLETFGMNSSDVKVLSDIFQVVNQFLRYEYKTHLNRLDGCTDHCTVYALSDSKESKFSSTCDHDHDQNCDKCSMVDTCVELIRKKFSQLDIPTAVMEEINYEIDLSERNLIEWKKHLLRTIHQDNARSNILKSLTSKKAFVIMDWAMKFLPFQYRETQSEFFGKKGFSWHVSCVITTADDINLDLQCYVHILENGSQGWFSVANILLHLLHQMKEKKPEIEEVYLKSDNAACYHCTNLLAFIQLNNRDFPVYVKEYNFSEAQSGKDLCDSKTGSSRLHIYKYANEGNNVVTTSDMKKALESYGGVRGTQACTISIDPEDEPKVKVKIPGISMLNNFSFGDDGIKVRKAYEVGEGQLIKNLNDQKLLKDNVFKLKVLEPFPEHNNQPGRISNRLPDNSEMTSDVSENAAPLAETISVESSMPYYCCPDDGCNKVFATSTNLEKHLATGNHSYRTTICGLDSAVEIYASQCESLRDYQNTLFERNDMHGIESVEDVFEAKKGWALKGKRSNTRFSENVKSYLRKICISCEKTGARPDYNSLSEELRKATDENGQKLFLKDEWLNPSQIKGFVAQFLSKSKASTENTVASIPKAPRLELQEALVEDDEKLSEIVNMLEVNDFNKGVSSMVDEVFSNVDL